MKVLVRRNLAAADNREGLRVSALHNRPPVGLHLGKLAQEGHFTHRVTKLALASVQQFGRLDGALAQVEKQSLVDLCGWDWRQN